jgi:hypothetical protein
MRKFRTTTEMYFLHRSRHAYAYLYFILSSIRERFVERITLAFSSSIYKYIHDLLQRTSRDHQYWLILNRNSL